MDPSSLPTREPLSALLVQLRDVLLAQAEALGSEDFDSLERLSTEREQLAAKLDQYSTVDAQPGDHALLEQIGALDQRLLAMAQSGLEHTRHELRDIHHGRSALTQYQRRGNTLLRSLTRLDLEG